MSKCFREKQNCFLDQFNNNKPNKLIDKLPVWTNKLIKDHAKKKKEIEEMEVNDLPEGREIPARVLLRRLEELEKKIS